MDGAGNIDDSEVDSDHYDESRGEGPSSYNIRRDPEVHGIDSYVSRQIKHVLSLGEWAARTTQPYAPEGAMGDAVKRQVGELAFYAPKSCSASWMQKFGKLVHHCHSARLCKMTGCQKMQLREGGRLYFEETNTGTSGEGEWDRCVICKTKEDKATWCVDLACNPDMRTYDAREFLEKPGEWGSLFDKAFRQHSRIFEDDWSPTGEYGMPLEFVGSFAIGDTCKGHLVTALAAQNMPFEMIYNSMSALRTMEPDVPEYSDLPTVTDDRVKKWYDQRERIQYALAQDNKTHRMPHLEYCKTMWDKIDDSIIKSLGPGATQEDLYRRSGYWAARSMHRASHLSPEQPFASEEEEETERNQRPQQPAGRRRARRQVSDSSEDEDARPAPQRQRREAPRRAVAESEDDHEEEEEEAPAPSSSSAPRALRRPRRNATPVRRKFNDGDRVLVNDDVNADYRFKDSYCTIAGFNHMTRRYMLKSQSGCCQWFYEGDLAFPEDEPTGPVLPENVRRLAARLPLDDSDDDLPRDENGEVDWNLPTLRQREAMHMLAQQEKEAQRLGLVPAPSPAAAPAPAPARSPAGLGEIYGLHAQRQAAAGPSSSRDPLPPIPAREPRQPLNDLAAAASGLRSLVTGPSPQHRILRGYATSIAEMFDLARVLTEKELHVEAGVAGRGAVVMQELAAKYQDERAR